ncbi:MAG: hypothetical protein ACLQFR_29935 [Streptosporangiaceae bacterium]
MLRHIIGLGGLAAFWFLFLTWLADISGNGAQGPAHAVAHLVMVLAYVVVATAVSAVALFLFRKRLRRLIPASLTVRWRNLIVMTGAEELGRVRPARKALRK